MSQALIPELRLSSGISACAHAPQQSQYPSLLVLSAGVDLISFSGILYSIYPPLFLALVVYSIGGTGASLFLGRKLVGLNFQQEAQEANFRHVLLLLCPESCEVAM